MNPRERLLNECSSWSLARTIRTLANNTTEPMRLAPQIDSYENLLCRRIRGVDHRKPFGGDDSVASGASTLTVVDGCHANDRQRRDWFAVGRCYALDAITNVQSQIAEREPSERNLICGSGRPPFQNDRAKIAHYGLVGHHLQ